MAGRVAAVGVLGTAPVTEGGGAAGPEGDFAGRPLGPGVGGAGTVILTAIIVVFGLGQNWVLNRGGKGQA